MLGPLRWLSLAVVLTALPVTAGVAVLDDDAPAAAPPAPPPYTGTPLTDFDTTTVTVARAPFCDRLPEEAVSAALDGEARTTRAYDNGEAAPLATGLRDVAHEYGCRVAGARGAEARAWLFAPPVTRTRARELVEETPQGSCDRPAHAPAYGAPSTAQVCRDGSRRSATFRGLFGDAWLACSLTAPAALTEQELLDRAGRWCVAVAQAAAASD